LRGLTYVRPSIGSSDLRVGRTEVAQSLIHQHFPVGIAVRDHSDLRVKFLVFSACSTSLVDVDPRIIRSPESDVNRLVSGTGLEQGF